MDSKTVDIEDIIDSVSILDYISQFTDFEQKNGEYWALSPLKDEKTPSFSVNTELNKFFDFSSGKGGNILNFIMSYNHCSSRTAEAILRQYADGKGINPRRRRMEATKVAKKFIERKGKAKEEKNVFLPDDFMCRYEKDYDKLSVWEAEGISRASMDKFQVYYDRVSSRIVYPIKDVAGNIINVSGRTLDPEWKEKRLRKYTYFFPLGTLNTIYGLAENRESVTEKKEIILFEGAKSVMLADTWGIHNTGAILTSHLNQKQLKILASLGVRVVFALDKDVDITKDNNISHLKWFVPVERFIDRSGLLSDKMAPVDAGKDTWDLLYSMKERV